MHTNIPCIQKISTAHLKTPKDKSFKTDVSLLIHTATNMTSHYEIRVLKSGLAVFIKLANLP